MRRHRSAIFRAIPALPGALIALAGSSQALGAGPWGAVFDLALVNGSNGVILNGAAVADRAGWSVAGNADLNGDGWPDVVVGAPLADAPQNDAGKVYVVYGPVTGAQPTINLSALNGTNGFVINGIDASDRTGEAIDAGGDVNNDGYDDLVIGASGGDPGGLSAAGEAYIVFGAKTLGSSGSLNLSSLNGTNGFVINGVLAGDSTGDSVAFVGDIKGDGRDDVAIGAPKADVSGIADRGSVFLVYGSSTVGASGSLNLSTLNGSNGIRINGSDGGDEFGTSICGGADSNGDGHADLLAGAPLGDPGVASGGEVYAVFGGPGIPAVASVSVGGLPDHNRCYIRGAATNDFAGRLVADLGDVNGDGFTDVGILGNGIDTGPTTAPGAVYVFFGGPSFGVASQINLSSFSAADGFIIQGLIGSDSLNSALVSAGDINGDGYDDIIVTSYFAESSAGFNNGQSFIVFGGPTVGSSGVVTVSTLTGANGFRIDGDAPSDYSGHSAAGIGDINGDGIDDICIGAIGFDANGNSFSGGAYILFGKLANVWTSTSSGSWSTASRWLGGVAPTAGTVKIQPSFGVTVTAPSSAVFLDTLTIGADFGRTTVDLAANSLVSVHDAFTIPSKGGLSGDGLFACDGAITNSGRIAMDTLAIVGSVTNSSTGEITSSDGVFYGTVTNAGLIDLTPQAPTASASVDILGKLTNNASGDILMRNGTSDLSASSVFNSGHIDVALAVATVFGDVTNEGTPAGNGFTPLGGINIIEESFALFLDDVTNQSAITLDADSSIAIMGTLFGNGISGPGGLGTAGAVFLGGGVSPGFSPGIARFDGDATLGGTAITTIEIGGTTPGTGHDQIQVAGVLGAAGTLRVDLINGYLPQGPVSFKVLEFGSVISAFSVIELDASLIARNADTSTLLIDGIIRIPAPSCSGDINGDGFTNAADFTILAGTFGSAVTPNTGGDLNGDGLVNAADFVILAGDFGCGN